MTVSTIASPPPDEATIASVSSTRTRPQGRDRASASIGLEELRSRLTGPLITPDHPGYDTARGTIYTAVDRYPWAIVRAANANDAAEAVVFASEYAVPLAVRSGGHSLASLSVIDDALVVDLSAMNRIAIDPASRTARIQPGAASGELAWLAHVHGLALSTGDTHSVGMGGLVIGGGIGFMVRKYGLTIDNLLSAQVVTAAGEIVHASAFEHADLFWAIRGGGGNVGIVTEFLVRLAPVRHVLGGELILPATREVLRGYLDLVAAAPDDLTTIAALMRAPAAPHIPPEHVGALVLDIIVCWTGDPDEGEQILAPLRALANPVADTVAPLPYPELYRITAPFAEPHAASIRMMFADALSDETLDAAIDAMHHASSPTSLIQFRGLGGAMARVGDDATAFAHRRRRYLVAAIGLWFDVSADAAPHQAWTGRLWDAIRHEETGAYVNFLEAEGDTRIREAYPPATFARLAAIKRRYDPDNLFRFNQNVPPGP